MTDPNAPVSPEAVGQTRQEAEVRAATDRPGRTVLRWGMTGVLIFAAVVILFALMLFLIFGNRMAQGG